MVYKVIVPERARRDLQKMTQQLNNLFIKHFIKLEQNFVPKKHLRYGVPYFVEKVTESTRFSFEVKENQITIIRCFKNHKEYEKWYKSQ